MKLYEVQANAKNKTELGRVLIVGTGPVAVQLAIILSKIGIKQIGMVGRRNTWNYGLKTLYESDQLLFHSEIHKKGYPIFEGKVKITSFFLHLKDVDQPWDTIFYCTPSDTYSSVTKEINNHFLCNLQTIVLMSPSIGANLLVKGQLEKDIEVISLSTYFAATKWKTIIEKLRYVLRKQ